MTHVQALDHFEFACRSAVLISFNFIMGVLIGYFVSDREVDDE